MTPLEHREFEMIDGCGEVQRSDVNGALCRWEHPFLLTLIKLREAKAIIVNGFCRQADALCTAIYRPPGYAAAFWGNAPA